MIQPDALGYASGWVVNGWEPSTDAALEGGRRGTEYQAEVFAELRSAEECPFGFLGGVLAGVHENKPGIGGLGV